MNDLEKNYKNVLKTLVDTGKKDVILLAATKMQGADIINQAIKMGIRYIGENRVQELLSKYDDILKEYSGEKISFHFIGSLQTNKVKFIIEKVDLIHSVDSYKLALEIDKQARRVDKIQDILIEINISGDENKSGIELEDLNEVLYDISKLENVKICGLMCIGGLNMSKEQTGQLFSKMFEVFIDNKEKKLDNVNMEYLSMGMSGDYDIAVENGANIIRLGSCLFGKREYKEVKQ